MGETDLAAAVTNGIGGPKKRRKHKRMTSLVEGEVPMEEDDLASSSSSSSDRSENDETNEDDSSLVSGSGSRSTRSSQSRKKKTSPAVDQKDEEKEQIEKLTLVHSNRVKLSRKLFLVLVSERASMFAQWVV